ncbi:hypothetical protein ABFS83_05G032600 [Erythranthe nasuta]
MGKKMDALLGRSFKTSKLKSTAALAVSRLSVLKNQRQARCSVVRSDVVEFLKTSNHDRALLRVEQVMKEQNMLDVFVVLEGYCHLLIERVNLFEHEKVCPEELREAVSTLIFASTRCGEFPELQEIRAIFASRFGKEFASRAVELRNHCGVNPKIIQKLSTRMPTLEDKTKVLKEIASDNNIDLHLDQESETPAENEEYYLHRTTSPSSGRLLYDIPVVHSEGSERGSVGRKYKDVADAAQAAFESAAYAAAAARAAVELSRSESTDPPNHRPGKLSTAASFEEVRLVETEIKYEKILPVLNTNNKRSFSDDNVKGDIVSSDEEGEIIKRRDGGVHFDESDHEDEQKSSSINQENYNNPAEFGVEPLNFNRRPISVRNRRTSGR